jgi:hypothetical protein
MDKHPGIKHPFYRSWEAMKYRCDNFRSGKFARYGARGVTYSDRWVSFENFYDDMFSLWQPGLLLDRRNNDGDYTKDNCRFIGDSLSGYNKGVQRNSSTGISGVTRKGPLWLARTALQKLYSGPDFFEACCVRKSWENSYVR